MPERVAENHVDPWFIKRWSPRALTGAEIPTEALMSLFEAARWSPSSYNNQPWRFIYARRNTPAWQGFLHLLIDHNRQWAQQAAALVVIASKRTFDNGKPSTTHRFDTGMAFMAMALQGWKMGWVVHGMEGFDNDQARELLNLPDDYDLEAMAAIGQQGSRDSLPKPLQEKEFPSDRKKPAEIVFEGKFQ